MTTRVPAQSITEWGEDGVVASGVSPTEIRIGEEPGAALPAAKVNVLGQWAARLADVTPDRVQPLVPIKDWTFDNASSTIALASGASPRFAGLDITSGASGSVEMHFDAPAGGTPLLCRMYVRTVVGTPDIQWRVYSRDHVPGAVATVTSASREYTSGDDGDVVDQALTATECPGPLRVQCTITFGAGSEQLIFDGLQLLMETT